MARSPTSPLADLAKNEEYILTTPEPLKILHIISGDLWAGAEVQAFTLLSALKKIPDVDVSAVLMNEGELAKRLREQNIPVTVFSENSMGAFSILIELRRLMSTLKPDVVHTHRIKENILGSIANRTTINAASIRTVHGAPEHAPKGIRNLHKHLLNILNRWTGQKLQDRIVAVSQDLAEKLSQDFHTNQIVTIENGIDIDATRARVRAAAFKTDTPDAIHIGIVGRLVPVKRVDIFLGIAELLKQKHPEKQYLFHIFGDGPLRNALEHLAKQKNIDGITVFHGHTSDIASGLAALDTLVMCSDHEGLPMTLLEALALGVPIVAHAVGGIPNVLANTSDAVLVEQQDPANYANALDTLTNRERTHSMLSNDSIYSATENAKRFVALYNALSPEKLIH